VEAVGDLDRARRPGAGAVGECWGPVPAQDLDARVGGQPVGQRLGVAALDEVQRGTGLAVDDQGAVALAAPDREVVHPGHPRGRRRRVGSGHDQPEHDVPGRGDAQRGGQPGPGAAGQRDRDPGEDAGQQRGLARVGGSQALNLLGEDLALALGDQAGEPADRKPDLHLPAADRGVGQRP
jgi:hypothetical protein